VARQRVFGAETGDTSEIALPTAGVTADGIIFNGTGGIGGAYAYKMTTTTGIYLARNFNLSRGFFRFYFIVDTDTAPASQVFYNASNWDDGAVAKGSFMITQQAGGAFSFYLTDSVGAFVNETVVSIAKNIWYRVEIDLTVGAGTGACVTYLNGVVVQSVSSQNFGAGNIANWGANNNINNTGRNFWLDDLAVDDAGLCGAGYVVARQFEPGTPTSNNWTLTGGASINTVWSDTPFNAATFATSPNQTGESAQTALTASFSATQSGHGGGVIDATAAINAIKVGGIAKASSTADNINGGIIRALFDGVATDTQVTLTTSDAYYETPVFTDSLGDLNASEVGWNKEVSATAGTQTVEDMWVMAEYTPGVTAGVGAQIGDVMYAPKWRRGWN
jgi:hypothetical protein